MFLYIRHGEDREDKYDNDGKITENAKIEIKEKTLQLLEEHGIPDIIYYGPFYRTYQTTKYIKKAIKKNYEKDVYKKIKFIPEPKIGRYVTRKQRYVRDGTIRNGAILDQSSRSFKKGILEHFQNLKDLKEENGEIKIWNVTHAYVMTYTSRKNDIPFKDHVSYLDVLVIS